MKIVPLMALAVVMAGVMGPSDANAAQFGLYVGGHYAQTSKDVGEPFFADLSLFLYDAYGFAPTQGNSTFDDEDSGYGFIVGYRLTPHFAVEGGYVDLGDVAFRDVSDGTDLTTNAPGTWNQSLRSNTTGLTLTALGILPLSYRWEVYGRVGVMLATNDFSVYVSNGPQSDAFGVSESSTDYLAGVGASFSFAEIYGARLEYQRYFDAGADETGEGDVDAITLGVTVAF